MHAIQHLHPRGAILTAVAALALALAAAAVLAAATQDASFSVGAGDRGAAAQAPVVAAPATRHDEPAWEANRFAYPLLQVPSR